MNKMPLFWRSVVCLLALFLAAFLYAPVVFMLKEAFTAQGNISLAYFGILFRNSMMIASIGNSLLLGCVVTLICLALSLPIAWFATRYRFRGQWLINALIMVPMVLPPFVGAIGMKQFLSRFGTLNLVLMKLGVVSAPVDWLGSGFWGVVVLEVLHLFPIIYLNMSASLANIDPSLEEAAWNLGSRRFPFIRKILLPLAMPGIFAGAAIVFIWSVTDLGTPLILEYRGVVAYQIYVMINDIHSNPMGYALVVLLLVWIGLIYYTSKQFFNSRQAYMANKAVRLAQRPAPAAWYKTVMFAYCAVIGVFAIMPHCMVILTSVAGRWFMTVLPEQFTLQYYQTVLTHPLSVISVRNSIFLSSVSTTLDIAVGVLAAFIIARMKFRGRALLDFSVMLPLAMPGLILAFGYVGMFAGTWLDPRGNPFPLLVIAYAVRRLPFMVRSVDAGLRQIDPSMEEASLNLGASPLRTLWKVTLPLVSTNVIAGGLLVFTFAVLEVSDSLILAMKENYYPVTKAIYALVSRIADGMPVGSALGVFAMLLLAGGMFITGKILGRKMGELFRM